MYRVKGVFNKLNVFVMVVAMIVCFSLGGLVQVSAMPFYDLQPQEIVTRSQFATYYNKSSSERKHNIKLAVQSLYNTFVDVGGEFSFNNVVGERTENRGYKRAKIIVDGKFVDGVGGGVCQVSTTLYNAVLLAGLKVTEYHAHSLPVKYVEPSFDAMVNSGWADFKFVNNTHNPIIIRGYADGYTLTIEIMGERQTERIVRKSFVVGSIAPLPEQEITDNELNYPELSEGEEMVIRPSTKGVLSEGYIEVYKGDKLVRNRLVRRDKYSGIRGIKIKGKGEKKTEEKSFY